MYLYLLFFLLFSTLLLEYSRRGLTTFVIVLGFYLSMAMTIGEVFGKLNPVLLVPNHILGISDALGLGLMLALLVTWQGYNVARHRAS